MAPNCRLPAIIVGDALRGMLHFSNSEASSCRSGSPELAGKGKAPAKRSRSVGRRLRHRRQRNPLGFMAAARREH